MPFDESRFCLIVNLAMRAISLRDGIAICFAQTRTQPKIAPDLPPRPFTIKSQGRSLEARLVLPTQTPSRSVLILHGIGERLGYWHDAQRLLASHGIASLIVHYSGYGCSTGAITRENLRQDTIAAYVKLRELVPNEEAPFLLGLSLGTGVAVDAAPRLEPPPSGIVLCEPFSSLRDAAGAVCKSLGFLGTILRPLSSLVPDFYRSAATIQHINSPLLIVHSDADELFPVTMAREIHAAAAVVPNMTAQLVITSGFTHNGAYLRPALAYWQPILDFIMRSSASA
jgi:alpha-beta hydrolase superfamily lysophospholipase